jgi:hypothetical protein
MAISSMTLRRLSTPDPARLDWTRSSGRLRGHASGSSSNLRRTVVAVSTKRSGTCGRGEKPNLSPEPDISDRPRDILFVRSFRLTLARTFPHNVRFVRFVRRVRVQREREEVDIHPSRNLATDYSNERTDDLTMEKEEWFWAAAADGPAGDRFVIEEGDENALLVRVCREIDATETDVSWNAFGIDPTLADCFDVWITCRERYGVNHNRLIVEMARIPTFARWVRSRPKHLGSYVSNPNDPSPLVREPYRVATVERLRRMIEKTLS